VLPPEPVEIWRKEIQALRACVELWDSIVSGRESGKALEQLGRKISEHLACVPFYLRASEQGFCYCPVNLSAALWQRFASEVAGLIHPARCPAPNCGRWFLRGTAARSDKRFCSNACKNRAFRRAATG
jgi:predicted RNA-binding Zn ribbon-like protein